MRLPKDYRAVIDELGAVQAKLEPSKPLRKREKELREQIEGWIANLAPTKEKILDGVRYSTAISARKNERSIVSMWKVMKAIGDKAFLAACFLPLKVLDEYLAPEQQKGLVTEAPTGPRTILTMPRLAGKRSKR